MPNIVHKIGINAPIDKVYDAVSTVDGLKGWWTESIDGESKAGEKLTFRFPESGPVMEVLELESPEFVKWKCVDCVEDWKDTICIFELHEEEGITKLIFSQNGWQEESDFFAHCNMKWATFMLSLKKLCEEGKGHAFPDDIKIDKEN